MPPQRVGLFSPFDLITGMGEGVYTLPILVWNRNSQEYPTTGNMQCCNCMVYDIDEPFSLFETQFNNDNTVCIVSNLSTLTGIRF